MIRLYETNKTEKWDFSAPFSTISTNERFLRQSSYDNKNAPVKGARYSGSESCARLSMLHHLPRRKRCMD